MGQVDREELFRKNGLDYRFRLVEETDIRPGAKLYAVPIYRHDHRAGYPDHIHLDDEPTGVENGQDYVYYHMADGWQGQCFVPRRKFLGT